MSPALPLLMHLSWIISSIPKLWAVSNSCFYNFFIFLSYCQGFFSFLWNWHFHPWSKCYLIFIEFNVFQSQERYDLDKRFYIYSKINFQNMEFPPTSKSHCLPYGRLTNPLHSRHGTGLKHNSLLNCEAYFLCFLSFLLYNLLRQLSFFLPPQKRDRETSSLVTVKWEDSSETAQNKVSSETKNQNSSRELAYLW